MEHVEQPVVDDASELANEETRLELAKQAGRREIVESLNRALNGDNRGL